LRPISAPDASSTPATAAASTGRVGSRPTRNAHATVQAANTSTYSEAYLKALEQLDL
jgi:hypothetical protein